MGCDPHRAGGRPRRRRAPRTSLPSPADARSRDLRDPADAVDAGGARLSAQRAGDCTHRVRVRSRDRNLQPALEHDCPAGDSRRQALARLLLRRARLARPGSGRTRPRRADRRADRCSRHPLGRRRDRRGRHTRRPRGPRSAHPGKASGRGVTSAAMGTLRHRNFRLLFAGRAISFFGTNVVPVALAFAVLDLGSASDLGLVLAARTLAQIGALLAGGVFGDRLPRKLVLIGSDSANCAIQLGMGLLLVSGHAEVWHLIVLQLAGGVSTAFHSPATSGLVPQTVPADALQQANAFMTLSRYGATILGA